MFFNFNGDKLSYPFFHYKANATTCLIREITGNPVIRDKKKPPR
jgi:hypothetical protein